MEQYFLEAAKQMPALVVLMLGVSYFLNYMKEEKKLFLAAMQANTKALNRFTIVLKTLALMHGREDLANLDESDDEMEKPKRERPSSVARMRRRNFKRPSGVFGPSDLTTPETNADEPTPNE